MRRLLLLSTCVMLAMALALSGAVSVAFANTQNAPAFQDETATPMGDEDETATPVADDDDDADADDDATATPGSLPDTGASGGVNIALLGVLGAFALGVAGAALLSSGRKSRSES